MNRKSKKGFRFKKGKWQQSLVSLVIGLVVYGFYSLVENVEAVRLPQSEHPAELYSTQIRDDLRMTYVAAIEHAKQSVDLAVYNLTDSKVINALKKKAEEGVRVRVVYDLEACPHWVAGKLGNKVELVKRQGRGLMHHKILIIDGVQTWIGSANMTPSSLKSDGNLVAAIQSEPLAEMVGEKAKSLLPKDRAEAFLQRHFLLGNQTLEMWFLPDNTNAVDRILELINQAKSTIRVAMFTWTRRDFAQAIIKAHQRGVDVTVAMDQYSGKGASAEVAKTLLKAGVPVYFNQGSTLLHYKTMIVDDQVLVNGSANWTKAAFTQNDDCFMILYDLNEAQVQMLHRMWDAVLLDSEIQKPDASAVYFMPMKKIFDPIETLSLDVA